MRKRKKETPIEKIERKIEEAQEAIINLKYNTGKNKEDIDLNNLIIEIKDIDNIEDPILNAQIKIKQMSSGPLTIMKKQEIDNIIKEIMKNRKK